LSDRLAPNQQSQPQASGGVATGELSAASLQVLIDQVATFNVFVIPERSHSGSAIALDARSNGIKCRGSLHRFDMALEVSSESGVKVSNKVGEAEGQVDMHWIVIPNSFAARPDTEPQSIPLDRRYSQRFALQEMTLTFGNGDGFRSFGTGRTFPITAGGRPRLVVAGIGNVMEASGRFAGHEGNFTFCGELMTDGGFTGHIITRILDEAGKLRTRNSLPPPTTEVDRPDPEFTYLMWLAQKGKGPEQANRPSLTPDGQFRGLNIPMELKRGYSAFTTGEGGFRASDLVVKEVIGLEVGFGRGSQPGAPPTGTALSPFQFEGVARYSLDDHPGHVIGSIVTNVLEGRRFDYRLAGAPAETARRFGFFGPVIYGGGGFE
jgi:hypothetical protein